MSGLTFAQARGYAEKMKNLFKSFEKLDETLVAAQEADVFLKKASKEIPTLTERLKSLRLDTEAAQSALEDARSKLLFERTRIAKELDSLKEGFAEEKKSMQDDLEVLKEKASSLKEQLKAEHAKWMEHIEAERKRTLIGLEEAKNQVSDFLKKVGIK